MQIRFDAKVVAVTEAGPGFGRATYDEAKRRTLYERAVALTA